MVEFKYAPMFQVGKDDTEYYLLTKEGVSVSEFEGKEILKVTPEALTRMANQAFRDVSFLLRRSHNLQVAKILRGKYKPTFTPNADCGDNVIVINAEQIVLTGKKMTDKIYLRYTGFPGGQREMTPEQLLKKPEGASRLIKRTVKGMLPKTKLGDAILNNLYVYAGSEHPHEAQQPKSIDINSLS